MAEAVDTQRAMRPLRKSQQPVRRSITWDAQSADAVLVNKRPVHFDRLKNMTPKASALSSMNVLGDHHASDAVA
jgi:hypothetical protein